MIENDLIQLQISILEIAQELPVNERGLARINARFQQELNRRIVNVSMNC